MNTQLHGNIDSLEEIQTKGIDVLQISDVLASTVPKHTLQPGKLLLEEGDVPVCVDYLSCVVLDLPHHLDQDLYTLGLDHLCAD